MSNAISPSLPLRVTFETASNLPTSDILFRVSCGLSSEDLELPQRTRKGRPKELFS